MAAGIYEPTALHAGYERLTDHAPVAGQRATALAGSVPGQVLSQWAVERPLSFAGNDVPGVMLASAFARLRG